MPFPELTMKEIASADEAGIKLEITEGLPTWEFHPVHRHQALEASILRSVRKGPNARDCACYPLHDTVISFPDGSLKRPDLAIFCRIPEEMDSAIRLVPNAAVEIVSPESARKDYEINPPFYLKHGVLDVIVVEPVSRAIAWFTAAGRRDMMSPQTLELQCGCVIDV